jgi:hypothetical protein
MVPSPAAGEAPELASTAAVSLEPEATFDGAAAPPGRPVRRNATPSKAIATTAIAIPHTHFFRRRVLRVRSSAWAVAAGFTPSIHCELPIAVGKRTPLDGLSGGRGNSLENPAIFHSHSINHRRRIVPRANARVLLS